MSVRSLDLATTLLDGRRHPAGTRRWLPAIVLLSGVMIGGCTSAPAADNARPQNNADIVGKAKAATAVPGSNPIPAPVEAQTPAPAPAKPSPPAAGASAAGTPNAPATKPATPESDSAKAPIAAPSPTSAPKKPRPPARRPAPERAVVAEPLAPIAAVPVIRIQPPPITTAPVAPPPSSRVAAPPTIPPVQVPPRPGAEERSPIYSQADSDVIPAKLLTPQKNGPTFRNVAPDINTMELVISTQGRVEQVKLVTPPKRMTDMLMLSGAKTWKFSPALKNGQPVRYRTEFSWEMTP